MNTPRKRPRPWDKPEPPKRRDDTLLLPGWSVWGIGFLVAVGAAAITAEFYAAGQSWRLFIAGMSLAGICLLIAWASK